MSDPAHNKLRVYRCAAGHEIRVVGTWLTQGITQVDDVSGTTRDHEFNYCPFCFGAWAVQQWPLTCEEVE